MFVIANDWISTGAPVGIVLRVIGLKRSTFYRWRNIESYFVKPAKAKDGIIPGFSYTFDGKRINDLVIQKYITEILNDEFGQYYGYKKVTMVLRRSKNLKISKKKVFRLMSSMNLLNKRNISPRYSKRICKNHLIKSSNILWELDTKYVYIAGTKQVAYLASIIDVFDRSIVSYELSLSPNAESAKKAVIKALFKCIGKYKIFLMLSTDFDWLSPMEVVRCIKK